MAGAEVVPPAVFDNASMWFNLSSWTSQHLGRAVNMTRFAPTLEDLVWAGPRAVLKLGKLALFLPPGADGFGQRVVPDATGADGYFSAGATLAPDIHAAQNVPAAVEQDPGALVSRFSMEGARGIGSMFSYATSKWALCCIAMAIVLNRTHIFAATRRRLRLRWPVRLFLRVIPIALLLLQARSLLQSLQCQTSPDFAELRWGNASKHSELLFTHQNKYMHGLSSALLFGATDEASCLAARMIPAESDEHLEMRGSLSRLWPLFGTFCLSQFVETISCAVQGRPLAAETGMTIFEHSLAFAEADAAISNQLGWGLFGSGSPNMTTQTSAGANIAISRAMILRRVNTPPEVLLVAFFSAMSHVTSHALGVFNLQTRFRLVSTGFWALCYMGSIIWSALTFSLDDDAGQSLLRFPTVCIIGFVPHVLVLMGIFVCFSIYAYALLLAALATPTAPGDGRRLTFRERLAHAHANMQANVPLSEIRITMQMDFYTALLRAGFAAITMASEAVYLNEDRRVNLHRMTWLEEQRYREMEEMQMQWIGSGIPGSRYESIGTIGLVPVKDGQMGAASGYARERAAQKVSKPRAGEKRPVRDGVGAAERSGRWVLAVEYLMHINRLVITAWAVAACRFLALFGIRDRPAWLVWLARRPKGGRAEAARRPADEPPYEWLPSAHGTIQIPRDEHVDVEHELRRRLRATEQFSWPNETAREQELDGRLYGWWLRGGWWGDADASGDYEPAGTEPDLDATSVVSATESFASELGSGGDDDDAAGWETDGGDGRRTPTQRSPYASREGSPLLDTPMEMRDLARLLQPRSPEEREEARALAAHLASERVMTRSAYRALEQQQRAHVLLSNRHVMAAAKPGPEEEAQLLEQILLSRRAAGLATANANANAGAGAGAPGPEGRGGPSAPPPSSWATGAAGMGADGPQCVVCQCAPRTIIVWPCRCLSLCDDCRVSLAMNNFDKCVCCRREVISFSRIYVP